MRLLFDGSVREIAPDLSWPVKDGERVIGIMVNPYARFDEVTAVIARWDLQRLALIVHRIIQPHDPLFLVAQDIGDIEPGDGDIGRFVQLGHHHEPRIVAGEIGVLQIAVGTGPIRDPFEPQLVYQPVLQGAEHPLAAASGLGRVSRDMIHAQRLQGPPNLEPAPLQNGVSLLLSTLPPASGVNQ